MEINNVFPPSSEYRAENKVSLAWSQTVYIYIYIFGLPCVRCSRQKLMVARIAGVQIRSLSLAAKSTMNSRSYCQSSYYLLGTSQ